MKKEKHSSDIITEPTLHEILLDIKYRLEHIEDITADNRSFIIKLIKTNNEIVKFLNDSIHQSEEISNKTIEIELPPMDKKIISSKKMADLRELIDDYMDKRKDLKELEEELKKNKDMVTPGQIGDA